MTYTEIINDYGFIDHIRAILNIDNIATLNTYELLHKTREAINKDGAYWITFPRVNYIRVEKWDETKTYTECPDKIFKIFDHNGQEIEALAQALYFIYKETTDDNS